MRIKLGDFWPVHRLATVLARRQRLVTTVGAAILIFSLILGKCVSRGGRLATTFSAFQWKVRFNL